LALSVGVRLEWKAAVGSVLLKEGKAAKQALQLMVSRNAVELGQVVVE
jgi:hypothetical protein